ncbi:Hsp70 family protein [Flectobacillus sp. DC10W]|jgi:molecular chaperone DnaK (HSP70)|uniref:Hsp70 family protein n=1 Tax=Flectobacillus longus TaxID=2984207 RepID=A0ABT6YPQ8_9BACT|nr:Hsp70 family protein [Flectobacillus longus]MDI9865531.1 Hsp70 family protein [Flectobacillus longus]
MNLGIDLGSSNTLVATLTKDKTPIIIPDNLDKNAETTPSAIIIDNDKVIVGSLAKNIYQAYPDKYLYTFFKRHFGSYVPLGHTQQQLPIFSETLAAIMLKKVIYDAKLFINEDIDKIVVTVPSHYNDLQRRSVIEAAKLANIQLTSLLDEPIAAALYYIGENKAVNQELILIYDLGGGTFDLSVLTKNDEQIHVVAKGGINDIGGEEFDQIIVNKIKQVYFNTFGVAIKDSFYNNNLLKTLAEECKILINQTNQGLEKWFYFDNRFFRVYFDIKEYNMFALEIIKKTESCVRDTLKKLGLGISDINQLILIGGASNSKLLYEYWQKQIKPSFQKIIYHQPLTSVSKGAAIYANSFANGQESIKSSFNLKNVSSYNIAIKTKDSKEPELVIHKNTPLPVTGKKICQLDPKSRRTEFELCQYLDSKEYTQYLGIVSIEHATLGREVSIEIVLENKIDGTVGIKVYNLHTGTPIKFDFINNVSEAKYDFTQQKSLLDSLFINNLVD